MQASGSAQSAFCWTSSCGVDGKLYYTIKGATQQCATPGVNTWCGKCRESVEKCGNQDVGGWVTDGNNGKLYYSIKGVNQHCATPGMKQCDGGGEGARGRGSGPLV